MEIEHVESEDNKIKEVAGHVHTYKKELTCPFCDKTMEYGLDYLNYDESSERAEESIVKCDYCEKEFRAEYECGRFESKPLKCKKNKHDWNKHKDVIDVSWGWDKGLKQNVYTCNVCGEYNFRTTKTDGIEYTDSEIAVEERKKEKLERRDRERENYPSNKKKTGSLGKSVYDESLYIWTEEAEGNRRLFLNIITILRNLGFDISHVPEIEKNYTTLNKLHRYGSWKGLEFQAEYNRVRVEFAFYQNTYPTDRRVGDGKYVSNKRKYMPYLMIKRMEYAMKVITDYLASIDIKKRQEEDIDCHGQPNISAYETVEDKVKAIKTTHDIVAEYNDKDADKKIIKNGDYKYFYDYNNHLAYGQVFHNINNMWWVVTSPKSYFNKGCFELFDWKEDLTKNKKVDIKDVIAKLKRKLQTLVENSNFEKCIKIRDSIKLLEDRNKDNAA